MTLRWYFSNVIARISPTGHNFNCYAVAIILSQFKMIQSIYRLKTVSIYYNFNTTSAYN